MVSTKGLKERLKGKITELNPTHVKNRKATTGSTPEGRKHLKEASSNLAKSYMREASAEASAKQINNMLDRSKKKEASKRKQISNRAK